MSPNLLGVFGALAKDGAEAPTARAGRIAGLFQEGYLHWLDGVAASVESSTRFVSGLSGVSSSADLAALNCEWMNRTQALAVEQWETFVELSSQLTVELGLPRPPASAMLPFAVTPPLDEVFAAKELPTMAVPAAVPIPVPPSEELSVAPLTVEARTEVKTGTKAEAPPKDAPSKDVKAPPAESAPAASVPAEPDRPKSSPAQSSAKSSPTEPAQPPKAAAKPAASKLSPASASGAAKPTSRTAAPRRKPSPPKGTTSVQ